MGYIRKNNWFSDKGGAVKNDVIIKGGCKVMTYNDNGGEGVKITRKTSDVINGWPLTREYYISNPFKALERVEEGEFFSPQFELVMLEEKKIF